MKAAQYKLIAIDFDGTLLRPDGVIAPRVKQAIQRIRSIGTKVCFATGRALRDCGNIFDQIDADGPTVFVSGALVMHLPDQQAIHHTYMGAQLATRVAALLQDRGLPILALQHHSPEGLDYIASQRPDFDAPTQRWLAQTHSKVRTTHDLAAASHEHTLRLSIAGTPEPCLQAAHDLQEQFGQSLSTHVLGIGGQGLMLEVFSAGVSKWVGIRHVAELYNIENAEIVAVGDDANDVSMIKGAGLGVAMGNATTHVRQSADRIIGDNHNDGLADLLEELLESDQLQPADDAQDPCTGGHRIHDVKQR